MVSAIYVWRCTKNDCAHEFEQEFDYTPLMIPPVPDIPAGWTLIINNDKRMELICQNHAIHLEIIDFNKNE